MLILNQNQINKLFSTNEVLETIEKAFKIFQENQLEMSDRMHAHHRDTTLLPMPCLTESFFGTKLVSVNPNNPAVSIRMADELIKAYKDFELTVLPDKDHGTYYYDKYFIRKPWDFFVNYLMHKNAPKSYKIN